MKIMLSKALVLAVICLFILAGAVPSISSNVVSSLSAGNTLYVGGSGSGNYSTIQSAIDNASSGDMVFVYNGTYYENVNVNKHVNLMGEEKSNTIIDGKGGNYTIQILVNDVYITNFSITNATDLFWPDPWEMGALRIYQSKNITIKNNLFSNNFIGICLYKSNVCILRENMMYDCSIALWGHSLNSYIHDIDDSNFANEKPIFYYKNCENVVGSGDVGEIFFINCSNCSISNAIVRNVTNGIQVCYSNNVSIENNTITDIQSTAIHFDHSSNNTVKNNVLCRHRNLDSIFLDCSSYNNFRHNVVKGNGAAITLMYNSNHNSFYKNDIGSKNVQSMIIDGSNWNIVTCNNINGSCLKKIIKGK